MPTTLFQPDPMKVPFDSLLRNEKSKLIVAGTALCSRPVGPQALLDEIAPCLAKRHG